MKIGRKKKSKHYVILLFESFVSKPLFGICGRVAFVYVLRSIITRGRWINDNRFSVVVSCQIQTMALSTCLVPSIHHLCKSLVIENTKYDAKYATPLYYEKYYCCIIQYSSKLDSEGVARLFRKHMPHVSRKYVSFAPYVCGNRVKCHGS